MRYFALAVCGLAPALMLSVLATAGVPNLINYQGALFDAAYQPIDGTQNLTFRVHADSCNGQVLWEETHVGVLVEHGIFNVILGGTAPLSADLFESGERWMEVMIHTFPEVQPCMKITSVPWALRAAVADSISNVTGGWVHDGEVEVYTTDAGSNTYIDLDLSGITGSNRALVMLKVRNDDPSPVNFTCRINGEPDVVGYTTDSQFGGGISGVTLAPGHIGYVMVVTDQAGIIEHKIVNSNRDYTIYIVAHQRM